LLKENPTRRLSQRFKYTFSFPPQNKASLLTFLTLLPLLFLFSLDLYKILFGILISEAALFSSIYLERFFIKSKLATYKRLVSFSFINNLILLFFVFLAVISDLILYSSLARKASLIILGIFLLISFRMVIYKAIFTNNFLTALALGALQPLMVFFSLFYFENFREEALRLTLPYLFGLVILILSSFALRMLEDAASKPLPFNVFKFFKSFMLNWMENDSHLFDKYLSIFGKEKEIRSYQINFNKRVSLFIPGIHPGPIAGLGGCDLPYQIYYYLKNKGTLSFILHGFSNHEYDLASRDELKRFLSTLNDGEIILKGDKCTPFIRSQYGDIKVTCIKFDGNTALLLITASPKTTDDFDQEVELKIKELAKKLGYKEIIVIDCHNSLNDEEDIIKEEDLLKAAEEALRKESIFKKFKLGFSHSSEINFKNLPDISEAGIGILLLDFDGERFCIVSVDSNNAKAGIREALEEHLKKKGVKMVELCTSDTHSKTGRAKNKRGYYCFGELSDMEEIRRLIDELYNLALKRLEEASFEVKRIKSKAKVLGNDSWNYIATALERGLDFSKKSLKILGLVCLSFILTLIFVY